MNFMKCTSIRRKLLHNLLSISHQSTTEIRLQSIFINIWPAVNQIVQSSPSWVQCHCVLEFKYWQR